jgi:F0F1-type ATP synthase assembly protein I
VSEPETDKEREYRGQAAVYQGAFEAVVAILIAVGIGHWMDRYFSTSPLCVMLGFAVGFGAFVLRLLRLRRYFDSAAGSNRDQEKRP